MPAARIVARATPPRRESSRALAPRIQSRHYRRAGWPAHMISCGLLDNTGRSAAYLDSDADIGHGELIAEHEGLPREVSVQDLKGFLQTKSSRIRARSEGRQSHSPRTTQRGTAASISSAGGVPVLFSDGAYEPRTAPKNTGFVRGTRNCSPNSAPSTLSAGDRETFGCGVGWGGAHPATATRSLDPRGSPGRFRRDCTYWPGTRRWCSTRSGPGHRRG